MRPLDTTGAVPWHAVRSQEVFAFAVDPTPHRSSLGRLSELIDWPSLDRHLAGIYSAAKREPAWPPLALFRALLLALWYDLSDVRLAEALEDRASFWRFCGFAAGLPPQKWSSLMYGFEPNGGRENEQEETHDRGNRREAAAGGCADRPRPYGG
ncbi:transposase [Microvirga arabica]|uniref:Transposase n=1 Tax=Microvirga arabica TaxID=1128671 RepID=A0ABV6YBF7_9HYPH